MRYLINMGISGSVMMILFCLLKGLFKEKILLKAYEFLLKCALFFFLVPIPFMKYVYTSIWENITHKEPDRIFVTYHDELRILILNGKVYFNQSIMLQILTYLIWCVFVLIILGLLIKEQMHHRRQIIRCRSIYKKKDEDEILCRTVQKKIGVKKRIKYIDSTPVDKGGNVIFSAGYINPIILIPMNRDKEEKMLLLEHELIHIKRRDVLWKVIAVIAKLFHFYNPFTWLLVRELELITEMRCDEQLMDGKEAVERERYTNLLKQMLEKEFTGFRRKEQYNMNSIKKRIERLSMKSENYSSKRKIIVSIVVSMISVLLVSFTAFAYEDITVWNQTIDTDADVDRFINSDMVFLEEGTPLDASPFFIEDYSNVTLLYERQFIDENGNIYEIIDEPLKGEKNCIHNYVNGTAQIHERHQNGGCTMTYYSAQRCTKCGDVLLGDILNVINYSVCNH